MKIWYDPNDVNFSKFTSEQFLLLPQFSKTVIDNDNDFKNNSWSLKIKKFVELTSPEKADIFVYPKKLDTGIDKYINLAKHYNKKVYSFYNDDNSSSIQNFENLVLFRTSLYASKQKENEYAMPAWSQDLFVSGKAVRIKKTKPVVSFCGYISHGIRGESLNVLSGNPYIDKNFIIRDAFWGGTPHNKDIRDEYVNSIVDSDFVLCCRGAGNFSYRLYETLSCGRIPIIIDTDCVYPCKDKINWPGISIFITDLKYLNDKINMFWSTITKDEYISLQKHIRKIYENYIAPDGFARYLSYNI